MRYKYACFKSYIGFKNGMGLDKVEIDFSKSINKICLLRGANGVGKSTFLKTILGLIKPISGSIKLASFNKILYYEQEYKGKMLYPLRGVYGRYRP